MTGAAVWRALGTQVRLLVREPSRLGLARRAVERELAEIDLTCSRFREDSELGRLNSAGGGEHAIGPLLAEALAAALRAARMTGGAVDPTVGGAMRRIGYGCDFSLVVSGSGKFELAPLPVPGWRQIHLDAERGRVRVPEGVELDLGSTAKALAADRAAARARGAASCGVLVELGGDIAIAGPAPEGGWPVLVTDDCTAPLEGPGQVVHLTGGGLATSSTTVRRWSRGGVWLHHIVDPATGLPATGCWRTATVGAGSCLDANTAATAAMVLGTEAPAWLTARRLPARLVGAGGGALAVAGWPR